MAISLPPDECVERIPVCLAELGERLRACGDVAEPAWITRLQQVDGNRGEMPINASRSSSIRRFLPGSKTVHRPLNDLNSGRAGVISDHLYSGGRWFFNSTGRRFPVRRSSRAAGICRVEVGIIPNDLFRGLRRVAWTCSSLSLRLTCLPQGCAFRYDLIQLEAKPITSMPYVRKRWLPSQVADQ